MSKKGGEEKELGEKNARGVPVTRRRNSWAIGRKPLVFNNLGRLCERGDLRSTGVVGLRVSILLALPVNEDVNNRGRGLSPKQRRPQRRRRVLRAGFRHEYAYVGGLDWQRSWFGSWLMFLS